MKLNQAVLLAAFLSVSSCIFAQRAEKLLYLRSGAIATERNIQASTIQSFNSKFSRSQQKLFAVLQFDTIPSVSTRKMLSANGIELLEYIPDNAYTVSISGNINSNVLLQAKARSIVQLSPQQKMDEHLAKGRLPSWAVKTPGTVDVWVSFPKTFAAVDVIRNLRALNMDIQSTQYQAYRILSLRIAANRISDLADQPFIEYVQPAPPVDHTLNFNSRADSRANLLNASIANGGKGLNGEGVTVGVGDDANVQASIDFAGRLIDRSAASLYNGHGHHVTGTVAGAGNGNELYRGYAPKARIVSQAFSGIIANAATYVHDYGMVITNNSYGNNEGCDYYGTYDLYSRVLDQMAFDLPELQNVFAAGNSGSGMATCAPYPAGFHNIYSGYQSAKNVLTVGATDQFGNISAISSRGPVMDGRTKPEITAMGEFVASSWWGNYYSYSTGTSQAAPAVSGGLALLVQRYKQLKGGVNPKNALMKAIICNGANDKGNAGPDFTYGYGWMNLLRSVDMIENNHYIAGSSTSGGNDTYSISVPANTAQVKVMLYWNDPAASVLSTHTLVNDLDLEVSDPSASVLLPKILDGSVANVNNNAVTGPDHLNNMEQVVIDHPASGTYNIRVKGTSITQNPSQDYYVVYDIVPNQLKITSPAGHEGLAPSTWDYDRIKITWEAYGFSSGTSTLDFSVDDGATWTNIATGVDLNTMLYNWWVPSVATSQARVRITKDGSGETAISDPFTIIGQPAVSLDATQCEGYMKVNWTSVSGASDYQVMMLKGDEMVPVAVSTGNTYTLSGLSKDNTYWVTVVARINGRAGRRPQAVSRNPGDGNCAGSISDHDLKLDAVVSPVSGRMFTSTQLSAASNVAVRIKNLDDAPVSSFDVSYSVNGGAWTTEHVATTIPALGTLNYTFNATVDLSAPGHYNIAVAVTNNVTDPVSSNDTAIVLVRNIDNQPLDLSTRFEDNLESAVAGQYVKDNMGLDGIERYDFSGTTALGRLRTFVNTGIANSGAKAFTMDVSQQDGSGTVNYVTGTFNLVNYSVLTNDLRLDFQFNSHGPVPSPDNKVWIRGNDTSPWISVYDLDLNQADAGIYKKSESIRLSHLLSDNGQSFGPGFQIRWGQSGPYSATERTSASGYSIDDIQLYQVYNDFQLMSIDAPVASSCGLSAATPVKISVRNNDFNTLNNIPVKYRVNGGAWATEIIPAIPGNTVVQYTFSTTADLSALGSYTMDAMVDYTNDSFRDNDTTSVTIVNAPVISSFPYLENFEAGSGYWYANGKHMSWQYGTPSGTRINKAASGAKAWKTNLTGNYNDNELSYLYSPCFNTSAMSVPTLSFSVALDLEDCGTTLCDGAWVEYSSDGTTWTKLGTVGMGTNWYNKSGSNLWSVNGYSRWHVATCPLPAGISNLRLRFVLQSDPYTNYEGVGIDDIHIYDNLHGIYDGSTMSAPVTQSVSGSNWIDFTGGGKLIASLQPGNQNLGATNVQVYINTGAVRNDATQFYHDRNLTVKPENRSLADSVGVRFYFLDSETEALINATSANCPDCTRPDNAYTLGVSKYDDTDTNLENGTITDNKSGTWSYMLPANVTKVPFDKGYYAEFKVKSFSELWLNNGGLNNATSLPVQLLSFTAQRSGKSDVVLNWKTTKEINVSQYEVEVAKGNADLSSGHFIRIGTAEATGGMTAVQDYSFTDKEEGKSGPRYYRLKMIDKNGSFRYSEVRSVVFVEAMNWQVYPNPSDGLFNLVFQLNEQELMHVQILDGKGSLVKEYHIAGTGLMQKLNIDLSARNYASGIYLLQTEIAGKKQSFKLYKK